MGQQLYFDNFMLAADIVILAVCLVIGVLFATSYTAKTARFGLFINMLIYLFLAAASVKLTATEKKLVELYRDASAATKKEAMEVLKADKKPNDSLIEAVLANKDLAKTLNTLFKKK